MSFPKVKLSSICIGLIAVVCLLIDLDFKNWKDQERVIEHDIKSYYAYLPAYFIYDDIELVKSNYQYGDNKYLFWHVVTPEGKNIIKMTMGMSILYAPFFGIAHAYALYTDYAEDGFSEPYKLFLLLSAVFYLMIGLFYLRKILQYFLFTDTIISFTILLVGLGTNLLCYASESAPMSHVYNFSLFAIFIYYTIKWYELSSIKNTIIIGLLLGLITLIRPSNAVIFVFFILYGISNYAELKERLQFIRKDAFLFNLIFFFALIVWFPQFLYWKVASGNYLFYSYTDEGFFFDKPKILEGLFSFRKGWLVYTPMMAFSLIGIFFMREKLKKIRLSIILFLIVNVYVIFSWWCWWYGGTYGQRSMIDCYALLALPLAGFIKFVADKKIIFKIIFTSITLFFIWLNIFQTYQFEYKSLHFEGMTKELYIAQFGKLHPVANSYNLIDWPNAEEAKKGNSYYNKVNSEGSAYGDKKKLSSHFIQLLATNNMYVCAESNHLIYANKEKANAWETFELIYFENNECALSSYQNKILTTEIGLKNEISANRDFVKGWETFNLINLQNNEVAFKACNQKYLTIDTLNGQLFAIADSIGKNEKFKMITKY